jgi:hypothetical protein
MIDELIALFGQCERLSLYHFKTRSAIAEIALAPDRTAAGTAARKRMGLLLPAWAAAIINAEQAGSAGSGGFDAGRDKVSGMRKLLH